MMVQEAIMSTRKCPGAGLTAHGAEQLRKRDSCPCCGRTIAPRQALTSDQLAPDGYRFFTTLAGGWTAFIDRDRITPPWVGIRVERVPRRRRGINSFTLSWNLSEQRLAQTHEAGVFHGREPGLKRRLLKELRRAGPRLAGGRP